jgi:hypothetical protein
VGQAVEVSAEGGVEAEAEVAGSVEKGWVAEGQAEEVSAEGGVEAAAKAVVATEVLA